MGSKNVRLDDDVYDRLKREKRDGETFSEAVERLLGAPPLAEFAGVLSEDGAEEIASAIDERNRRTRRALREKWDTDNNTEA